MDGGGETCSRPFEPAVFSAMMNPLAPDIRSSYFLSLRINSRSERPQFVALTRPSTCHVHLNRKIRVLMVSYGCRNHKMIDALLHKFQLLRN